MKQTAVEWLVNRLQKDKFITEFEIEIAKEIENQEKNDYAIEFAEFSINYNYHPTHKVWIRYDKMANEKFTTKELLEIFKNK